MGSVIDAKRGPIARRSWWGIRRIVGPLLLGLLFSVGLWFIHRELSQYHFKDIEQALTGASRLAGLTGTLLDRAQLPHPHRL